MATEPLFEPGSMANEGLARALGHIEWAERLLSPPPGFTAYPAADLTTARATRAAAHAAVARALIAYVAESRDAAGDVG